jgi:hypothetical protein
LKKFGALSSRTGHWKQTAIETPNNRNPEQENVKWFTPRLRDRHPSARKHARRSPVKPRAFHPRSELLEGRALPSTLWVTNTKDDGGGSLRFEIAQAEKHPANDMIEFNIPKKDPGYNSSTGSWTITLTSDELAITTGLTIQGPGAGQLTVSGGKLSRVFDVNASAPVVLSGLTISNGVAIGSTTPLYDDDGGGILNLSTLTLSGCIVSGNSAAGAGTMEGGGIYNAGTLTLTGCTVSNNYASADFASAYGGGIYNAGTLTVSNSTLSGNSATDGGGGIFNVGTLTVSNSTFKLNSIYASGTYIENNIDGLPYTDGGGNSFS